MCQSKVFGDCDESQLMTLAGYYEKGAVAPTGGMMGKNVLITGADQGIGKGIAVGLARQGAAVVVVTRDQSAGEQVHREILRATDHPSVDVMVADLSVQAAVRDLASRYRHRHGRLHALVHNASVMTPRRTLTPDGLEQTLAVNHLAPFLLTGLLLDDLHASAPARIVNVTSRAHRFRSIDPALLHSDNGHDPQTVYAQSKLASLLFTFELARRLKGTRVTVNAADGGYIWPGGLQHTRALERAAATAVYLASSPQLDEVSGRYFSGLKPVEPSSRALDPALAQRIWALSERLTSLSLMAE